MIHKYGVRYNNFVDANKAMTELEAENASLKKKLNAVEYRLAEYMSTNDPVATSYAVQLRRIIAGAE